MKKIDKDLEAILEVLVHKQGVNAMLDTKTFDSPGIYIKTNVARAKTKDVFGDLYPKFNVAYGIVNLDRVYYVVASGCGTIEEIVQKFRDSQKFYPAFITGTVRGYSGKEIPIGVGYRNIYTLDLAKVFIGKKND